MHVPAHRPPPPIGVTITSRSGTSSQQLQRGGARAGDHPRVVERMDLHRAGACHDLGERGPAGLERVVAPRDLCAVALHRGRLERRGLLRHHDIRSDAALVRGARQRGRVIARRVGGDAARRVVRRERLHRVRRAPVLERARSRWRCSAFTNNVGADPLVERGRAQHRRPPHERRDSRAAAASTSARCDGHRSSVARRGAPVRGTRRTGTARRGTAGRRRPT